MKKTTVLFFALVLAGTVSKAQNAFNSNDKLLNVGVGLNSYYTGGTPVGASLEVGVAQNLSLGVSFDYVGHTYSYNNNRFSALYLGGRASYHFNRLLELNTNNVDLYGGVALGYRSFTWRDPYTGNDLGRDYNSGAYLGLYAGGKLYFSKKVSLFLELGAGGSTNARIGLGFKL